MIRYEYDIGRVQSLRNRFDEKTVNKALRWSVNRASNRAATFISREIRDTYRLKASDIKGHLRITNYQHSGASRALIYTGRRLPLEQFAPKTRWVTVSSRRKVKSGPRKGSLARRRGVSVAIRKDKGRQLVAGGWYAKEHILRRADPANNASDPRRQYGPSVPGMVAYPSVIEGAQDIVRRVLPDEFNGRMEYLLSQKAGQS